MLYTPTAAKDSSEEKLNEGVSAFRARGLSWLDALVGPGLGGVAHGLGLVSAKSSSYLVGFAGDYRVYAHPPTTLLALDGSGRESALSPTMEKRREEREGGDETEVAVALSNE